MKRKSPDESVKDLLDTILEIDDVIYPRSDPMNIGEGAFSKVYGYQCEKGKICAKVIQSISKRDFQKESSICEYMSKQEIGPRVYASHWKKSCGFIFMDYLPCGYKDIEPHEAVAKTLENLKKVSESGIFLVDLKPHCIRGKGKKIHLIDFSFDWCNNFPKTCECMPVYVWPVLCYCDLSSRKALSYTVMVIILFVMSIVFAKEIGEFEQLLWIELREVCRSDAKLIERVMQHDEQILATASIALLGTCF